MPLLQRTHFFPAGLAIGWVRVDCKPNLAYLLVVFVQCNVELRLLYLSFFSTSIQTGAAPPWDRQQGHPLAAADDPPLQHEHPPRPEAVRAALRLSC